MKHSQKSHSSAGYAHMIVMLFTLLCVLSCGPLALSLKAQTKTSDEQDVTPKTVPGRNGKIAFSGGDGIGAIYTTEANGGNVQRLTQNPRHDTSPKWSPDGTKIAFESMRDDNGEIYVMNADGSNQTRLTNNPAYDSSPIFSPDGTRIAFGSRRDNNFEIYVMNADGSNQTRLTNDPADDYSRAWSPDSSRIAFARGGDIYVINADGTNQTRLTTGGSDGLPRWSPDGSRIVFTSGGGTVSAGISVMNADGSNQTQLTNRPFSYYNSLDWSPDGSRITFDNNPDNNNYNYEIYVMNADGSNQIRLTNNSTYDHSPIFSPDGTRFAFLSDRDKIDNGWNYNDKIYVMNADGSSQTRLTNTADELYEFRPDWHVLPQTSPSCPNPIDCADFFVRQQYLDFLGREPDTTGFQNWVNTLVNCPNGGFGEFDNPHCDRVHVSAGFYQSEEFQARGFWAYRFYEVGFDRRPTYPEFIPDMLRVGGAQSPQSEATSKAAYTNDFVLKQEFRNRYDSLSNAAYLNALEQNAEVTLANKQALTDALNAGTKTRAVVLREVVEDQLVFNRFFNRGFVSMQYFGYLRRDPDTVGFQNWVNTLDADPNNFRHMIFGFIYSTEYRQRFGQP